MKKQTNNAASAIEAFRLRLTCSIKSSELLAQFSLLRILGTRSSADCRHRSPKPGGLRRALNWRSFWSAVAGLRGTPLWDPEHAIRLIVPKIFYPKEPQRLRSWAGKRGQSVGCRLVLKVRGRDWDQTDTSR